MSYPLNDFRIINPSIRVLFAGWESDTLTLSRAGWQISAEQDVLRNKIRFAFKHTQLKVYALSEINDLEYHLSYLDVPNTERYRPLTITMFASRMEIILHENKFNFEPVDAMPQIQTNIRRDIESFKIFKPISKAEEIVIAPANVPDLLDQIIKLQDPKQREIREKKKRELRRIVEGATMGHFENEYSEERDIIAQVCVLK